MSDHLPHRCYTTAAGDAQTSVECVWLVLVFRDRSLEQQVVAGFHVGDIRSEFSILISAVHPNRLTLYSLINSVMNPVSSGDEVGV
jgi:hypothetical protein